MNVSVISVGMITDWMELSDAAGEAASLCYVTDGHALNYPNRMWCRNNNLHLNLH